MALPLEQVVKQLADSGIIAPGKLENFVPPKAHPTSVDELVAELVKNNHLTPFQAAQVKGGRAKSLILGEYTILDKIGAGGMGQVFKAIHRRMDRLVAIKMLPPAMTKDAAAIARFEREVRAAAKLRHPNIVGADDAGQAGAAHFLVMEYVEGKDLSALVKKNGPFPVNKAVSYILQAARGLEFAHSEGVVHRDIKPANLLLDKKEVVKILDMGLARLDSSVGAESGPQADLTGTGTIMGTVDYMAPEQALDTKHADARADIYSLGISLYFLLAGRSAFEGDTVMKKLLAHREHPIPSLQDTQTTVSKQLDAVFKKMVAKRVEDRYQTMSEVVEALERLGFGGSSKVGMGDIASTIDLSSADRKKLAKATKKPLGSITDVVASEKTKHLVLKLVGGAFGTIIAPLLVFYLIRHLEKEDKPAAPPAATAPAATVPPVVVATNSTTQPIARVEDDGSPKPLVALFDTKQAHAGQEAWAKHLGTKVETTNSVGMRLTLIPPGEFLMGSTPEQTAVGRKMGEDDKMPPTDAYFERLAEEMPQHKVTITKPFLMGSTEVTVGQFRKFVEASKYVTEAEKLGFGSSQGTAIEKAKDADKGKNWKNPGYAITDDTAVTQITWNDAVAYCAWLSEQEQRRPWYRPDGKGGWLIAAHADGYRLPTEAEWEYACRAGTTTQYSFGDDKAQLEQYGWFKKNAGGKAQPVALKRPNPFGLFDIHGNAQEWCQDWYDGKWYEKSSTTDPNGPPYGPNRVIRGGYWNGSASLCRSASRFYSPSFRFSSYGFRCVRVGGDASADSQLATNTTTQQTTPVTSAAAQPNQPWNTPAFQAWVKATQALPAEKQIEAVSKKLMELNPGFDGKVTGYDGKGTPKVDKDVVMEIGFLTDNVTNISPVRALTGLKSLSCGLVNAAVKGKLSDLSPLQGMKLNWLACRNNPVSDLSPLRGMPLTKLTCCESQVADLSPLRGMLLTHLNCGYTQVADLSPLQGMPLESLHVLFTQVSDLSSVVGMHLKYLACHNTKVSKLTPLEGMPLTFMSCNNTQVSDLSPLKEMNLTDVWITPQNITKGMDVIRQLKSVKVIGLSTSQYWPVAEFWKKYDAGEFGKPAAPAKLAYLDPAFQQWVKDTQALPAEKQVEAVSKKLTELNPGFDGKTGSYAWQGPPKIENGVVAELGFVSDNVKDISPVRVLGGLKNLRCRGHGPGKGDLADLSCLKGMALAKLDCGFSQVSDLSPLHGMPLTTLEFNSTNVSDLSPLQGAPLTWLNFAGTKVADLLPLQPMPLTHLFCNETQVSDLSPVKGMRLTFIYCANSQIADLSPLKGMPLTTIWCEHTQVSDLMPLEDCKSLTSLNVKSTKATPASIAALQKALSNCKIEWDGSAKHITNINDPAFQQWMQTVATLTAAKQIEAVSKKLMELNPGFDGKLTGSAGNGTPKIENGMVTEFGYVADDVTDISPVRALPGLKVLRCVGRIVGKGKLSDLSPLQGIKLKALNCGTSNVSDLSPLQGMPLESLECIYTPISSLSPLQGMRLTYLNCAATEVTDLTPLKGMPLTDLICGNQKLSSLSPLQGMSFTDLNCSHSQVSDLSPLESCKSLKTLNVRATKVTPAATAALQKALPNCKIEWDGAAEAVAGHPNQPWETPAFQHWVKATQAVPAEKQIEAVSKKLMELNPGFDGKVTVTDRKGPPKIRSGVITELAFSTDNVTDISPIRALPGLKELNCSGSRTTGGSSNGKLSDLSPLKGMKLTRLECYDTKVSDLSPLQGMPLAYLMCNQTQVSDLSPLRGMPLTYVLIGSTLVSDLSPLQGMPLTTLRLNHTQVSDLSPLKGMKLANINCGVTPLSDLSPLRGMPLTELLCGSTKITDILPLEDCKGLKTLQATKTKVTPAQVAILQKALPNCKIEWDDPAKPKTPGPVASGTK